MEYGLPRLMSPISVPREAALFSSGWYLCTRKSPYVLYPISQTDISLTAALPSANVCLIDDGPLSLVLKDWRSSSTSSTFHTSVSSTWGAVINGRCDVFGLLVCPQPVVSQAFQHFRQIFREAANYLWGLPFACQSTVCLPVCLSAWSFHSRFNPACPHWLSSTPTGVFECRCWPSTHSSQGFPFHLKHQLLHLLLLSHHWAEMYPPGRSFALW